MHHTDTSDAYFVLLSLPFVRVHVYFRTCHLSLELESLFFFLSILQARVIDISYPRTDSRNESDEISITFLPYFSFYQRTFWIDNCRSCWHDSQQFCHSSCTIDDLIKMRNFIEHGYFAEILAFHPFLTI